MSAAEELFLGNLRLIEQTVAAICRRKGMTPDEIEEFSAEVKCRLIDEDYKIIRRFEGRGSFASFITVVVARALIDYRIQQWGKWNASNEARRLGRIAVELEQLLFRDVQTLDEAFVALRSRYPEVTRQELEHIAERLPHRVKRRLVELDAETVPVEEPHVLDIDRVQIARTISKVVTAFIDRLPPTDQMVLRMRFETSMTMTQIARAFHLEPKALYRQLESWFRALRKELERAGISASDIESLIGRDPAFLDFRLEKRGETAASEEQHA
jgi:RNA polymerase sigma factor (sigma-70 family)